MSNPVWPNIADALDESLLRQVIEVRTVSGDNDKLQVWYDGTTAGENQNSNAEFTSGIQFIVDLESLSVDAGFQPSINTLRGLGPFDSASFSSTEPSVLEANYIDFAAQFPGVVPTALIELDFADGTLQPGPIFVSNDDGQTGARRLVEFSDSPYFPTLIDSSEKFFTDVVGDGDIDYVAFEVPAGAAFDQFVLADYAGTDQLGFYALTKGGTFDDDAFNGITQNNQSALESNPDVIAFGHFGTTDEVGVVSVGESILSEGLKVSSTEALDPGFYTMLIQNTGDSHIAYKFDFGQGLVVPQLADELTGDAYSGVEDTTFTPITLPSTGQTDGTSESLTWSIPDSVPDWIGLNVNDLTATPPANFSTDDFAADGSVDFYLIATGDDSGNTASVPISLTFESADDDVPEIRGLVDPTWSLQTAEYEYVELTSDDLSQNIDIWDDTNPAFHTFRISNVVAGSSALIGADFGTAQPWAQGSNDVIDGSQKLFWRPAQFASGENLPAFNVAVSDDDSSWSTTTQSVSADVTAAVAPQFANAVLSVDLDLQYQSVISGRLDVTDSDSSDPGNLFFSITGSAQATNPEFSLDSTTGAWSFDIANATQSSRLRYDALADQEAGDLVIPVQVRDQTGYTADQDLLINVFGVNDAPVVPLSQSVSVAANVVSPTLLELPKTDVDRDGLSYSQTSLLVPGLALSSDGVLSFDPQGTTYETLGLGEDSVASIDFTAVDPDGLSDSGTVQVLINGVNDAPELKASATYSTSEDQWFEFDAYDLLVDFDATDVDATDVLQLRIDSVAQNSELEVQAANGAFSPVASGDFSAEIASTAKLRWKANADLNGVFNAFSIAAFDGDKASASKSVQINVSAVDDAPLLVFPAVETVNEGQAFSGALGSVTAYGESESLIYSMEGPDAEFFTLDQVSGSLSLNDVADYESKSSYDLTLRVTDDSTNQLTSASPFTLNVADRQDQSFALVPDGDSQVFIPEQTEDITLDLTYSQDANSVDANIFDLRIDYDSSRLDFVDSQSSLLELSGVDLTDDGLGQLRVSTSAAASLKDLGSLGSLHFDVKSDAAIATYDFGLEVISADNNFEHLSTGAVVAPDADAFINGDGAMDLFIFQNPLAISTSAKTVSLLDLDDVTLPFTKSLTALRSTEEADQLTVSQSLSFEANGGNDQIDLSGISPGDVVLGRLGAGRDNLIIPVNEHSGVMIEDFELGLDTLSVGVDGVKLQRRDAVLKELFGDQSESDGLFGARPDFQMQFSPVVLDLDGGVQHLISNQSPLIDSSVFLEPGSQGQALHVSFAGPSSGITLSDRVGTVSGPWQWDVAADSLSATLRRSDGRSDIPADLSDLRSVADDLVAVSGSGSGQARLSLEWVSGTGDTTTMQRDVALIPQPSVAAGITSFKQAGPVQIALAKPSDAVHPLVVEASAGSDSITLLSDALSGQTDKAFGGRGGDLLIAGDGDRLLGGLDHDTLIARAGLGVAQLTGDSGNDVLVGAQHDVLIGGSGNDVLVARGLGNKMRGGVGADVFVLADASLALHSVGLRPNRVLDFQPGVDQIAINLPGITEEDLIVSGFGPGAKIELTAEFANQIGRDSTAIGIVQNVSPNSLDKSQMLNQHLTVSADTLSRVSVMDQTI